MPVNSPDFKYIPGEILKIGSLPTKSGELTGMSGITYGECIFKVFQSFKM